MVNKFLETIKNSSLETINLLFLKGFSLIQEIFIELLCARVSALRY